MADPSACRDWYFPQQGMLSISETKRNHMGQGLGNTWVGGGGGGEVRQNSYFFFLQKRRNYCGGMSCMGHCHVEDGHV